MNVMDAALKVGAHYQDMASGPVSDLGFIEAMERQLGRDDEFKKAGFGNIVTKEAVEKLDSCNRIEISVYDGLW